MKTKLLPSLIVFPIILTTACSHLTIPKQPKKQIDIGQHATSITVQSESTTSQTKTISQPNPPTSDTSQTTDTTVLVPSEELKRLWKNITEDDITVLPTQKPIIDSTSLSSTKSDNKNKQNPPPQINIQLRKPMPIKKRNRKKQPIPVVKTTTSSKKNTHPSLTRNQVLEKEIRREQAALKIAKSQLISAKKKGSKNQINRLTNIIRDRELNIKAISKELIR